MRTRHSNISKAGLELQSSRLSLRAVIPSDAKGIYAYRSKPGIYRYQSYGPVTLAGIRRRVEISAGTVPDTPGSWYQLAITLKNTGTLIGDIGMHFIGDRQAEMGYTLAPRYHGKGYATEAVLRVLDYLFGELRKHRVTASTDPRNERSIKLLERAGMRKEACFRKSFWTGKYWADDTVYAMLRSEWMSRRENKL